MPLVSTPVDKDGHIGQLMVIINYVSACKKRLVKYIMYGLFQRSAVESGSTHTLSIRCSHARCCA